ncbi:unnamed protein product [Boreogadus saida]
MPCPCKVTQSLGPPPSALPPPGRSASTLCSASTRPLCLHPAAVDLVYSRPARPPSFIFNIDSNEPKATAWSSLGRPIRSMNLVICILRRKRSALLFLSAQAAVAVPQVTRCDHIEAIP